MHSSDAGVPLDPKQRKDSCLPQSAQHPAKHFARACALQLVSLLLNLFIYAIIELVNDPGFAGQEAVMMLDSAVP